MMLRAVVSEPGTRNLRTARGKRLPPACGAPDGQNSCGVVKPLVQIYSTLPKFGNTVFVAHPGLTLRGDHVSSFFASRACGGRSSVGREMCGQGGLLSVSLRLHADERR